jgi:hypothetical protein
LFQGWKEFIERLDISDHERRHDQVRSQVQQQRGFGSTGMHVSTLDSGEEGADSVTF